MNEDRYLVFTLGEDYFAVPLKNIREVIAVPEFTKIPRAPNYFLGISNLRGQIISALDLRLRLSIVPSKKAEAAVVIVDIEDFSIGVLVDSVNSVFSPKPGDITESSGGKDSKYIRAVFRRDNNLILLIDLKDVLTSSDLAIITNNSGQKKAS